MKLTRRELAASLALAQAAVAVPQAPPQTEDLDALARARLRNNVAAMSSVQLPMATEPAFQFKA
jgi:hypothetical protein